MKLNAGKIKIGLEFPFFALAAYFLSGDMRKNFMLAVLFSLLHETGHVVSIILSGGRITEICTDVSGIRINKSDSGMSYRSECITALAGPFVNLIFVLIFSFIKSDNADISLASDINLGLLLINLLPVRTLDGGRFVNNLLLLNLDCITVGHILRLTEIAVAVILIFTLVMTLIFNIVNTSFVFFVLMLEFMIVSGILKS